MNKLIVEPNPHIRSKNSTQKTMLHVVIALMPALFASVYIFGINSLVLTLVCVISCVASERIFELITKKKSTISDLSAVVTGILLAFNLPVTLPYYMAVIGSVIAIVIVKQMFGGLGQNFANPAITARIVLSLSFTTQMSNYVKPFFYKLSDTDSITAATPLALGNTSSDVPGLLDLFLGLNAGSLGETCAAALLLGFIYLLIMRVINPITPLVYVGTVALGAFLSGGNAGFEVLSGGLLLGAIFMATDYATTPLTTKGKVIFAAGAGLILLVIRGFSSMNEGVAFSILIVNILTPYIDKITLPKPFGYKGEAKKND